jgi:predicted permease
MLGRGASRAGEMAIRASLGASRPQLAAQLVAEAALLALLGGVASVPVARAVLDITVAAFPETLAYGLNVEWSALALFATASASLATLMIFGTVPALEAMRANPGAVMKGQSSQSVGGRAAPFRNFLAMIQIAFAMALLVLAGLFTQSLFNIARVELGVGVDSLVTFTVAPRLSGYTQQQTSDFFDRIEAELAAQPGVLGVAASRVLLFDDRQWTGRVGTLDGREVQAGGIISLNAVSPGFFRTVSIPLLGGRDLAHSDIETSPRVAVANESFLRRFNLGVDAVGKSFTFGDPNRPVTIVGIVADARYSNIKNEIPPQVFLSRHQFTNLDAVSFYVRGAVTEGALLDSVPRAVAAVDRTLPVRRLMTMRAHVDDNVYLDRLVTLLSAAFAVLATLLAAIGLYGVLAYNVSQRTRELGLRLALGATPTALRAMVLRNVVRIALVGLPIGLAVALAAGRAAEALLYGLSGYDPIVVGTATVVLVAVVLAAGFFPARRAARVAPMDALRHE